MRRRDGMNWWIWAAAGAAVLLFIDWLIVMGPDPRKWRGKKK